MIQKFLARTLAASVLVALVLTLQGCDGGGSTPPPGQAEREVDPSAPKTQAPGPKDGEFQEASTTTPPAPSRRPGGDGSGDGG